MKSLSKMPIIDNESQPSLGEAIGTEDMTMFRSPDISTILNELLNTDKDKIALSTNIDKKRTLNAIVSLQTYANNTRSLFRNVQDEAITALVEYDAQLIEQQIEDKLKAHKALKGYTTNKIIEAIQARISRMDKARAAFGRQRTGSNGTNEAL